MPSATASSPVVPAGMSLLATSTELGPPAAPAWTELPLPSSLTRRYTIAAPRTKKAIPSTTRTLLRFAIGSPSIRDVQAARLAQAGLNLFSSTEAENLRGSWAPRGQ